MTALSPNPGTLDWIVICCVALWNLQVTKTILASTARQSGGPKTPTRLTRFLKHIQSNCQRSDRYHSQQAARTCTYEYRTIRALHDHVFMRDTDPDSVTQFRSEQGLVVGEAPLLPIQNWFLSKPLQHLSYWNHTFYLQTPELDIPCLRTAINEEI